MLLDESTISKGERGTICQDNMSSDAVKKHSDSGGIDVVHSTSKYSSDLFENTFKKAGFV
jgi:hypothetical protein